MEMAPPSSFLQPAPPLPRILSFQVTLRRVMLPLDNVHNVLQDFTVHLCPILPRRLVGVGCLLLGHLLAHHALRYNPLPYSLTHLLPHSHTHSLTSTLTYSLTHTLIPSHTLLTTTYPNIPTYPNPPLYPSLA